MNLRRDSTSPSSKCVCENGSRSLPQSIPGQIQEGSKTMGTQRHLAARVFGFIISFPLWPTYTGQLCSLKLWCHAFGKTQITQEAYIVSSLMSYSRRYWRRALTRKTETELARRLKLLLKPNPRRSRATCKKGYRRGRLDSINAHDVSWMVICGL